MIIVISIMCLILAILIEMIWCCFRLSGLISEMEEKYERDNRFNQEK